MHSLEGKTNQTGLRWKHELGALEWNGLTLFAHLPPPSKDQWLMEALARRTKYCRIVRRVEGNVVRFSVQLIQEGLPPAKYRVGQGLIGIDVGPSSIAWSTPTNGGLARFCAEVEQPWGYMRRLHRQLDRSRRATNPDCFNADGTWKRGARLAVTSVRYQRVCRTLAKVGRQLAATRDRAHGELINRLLAQGVTVQAEHLSYRAFQRTFGRSVAVRAPGMFIEKLRRKAESAGGEFIELNTQALKLSQYDHPTQTYRKKALSERWHVLGDNRAFGVVQRDVYSAFLAATAVGDGHLPSHIETMWAARGPALKRAGWWRDQPSSVVSLLATAPPLPAPERVARERRQEDGHTREVVALARELGNPVFLTPLEPSAS